MPLVTIKILEGRNDEQKEKLFASVTKAVCESVNCPADAVHIDLIEMTRNHYAIAGIPKSKEN